MEAGDGDIHQGNSESYEGNTSDRKQMFPAVNFNHHLNVQ